MTIYIMLLAHWFGDFVLQVRWLAENKSKNLWALLGHIIPYTITISVPMWYFFPDSLDQVLLWTMFNGSVHGVIDSVTSKITATCWERKWIYPFWWVIGFDQMLHVATLLASYKFFLGGQL